MCLPISWGDPARQPGTRVGRVGRSRARPVDHGDLPGRGAPRLHPALLPGGREDGDVVTGLLRLTHLTIKKVTRDIEDEKFNTAVAAMMEMVNGLYKIKEAQSIQASATWRFTLESLLQILAPFAPHITEELWHELGHTDTIHVNHWPKWDEKYLVSDVMTIIVQVNGKLRSKLELPTDIDQQGVEAAALADANVQKFTNNKPPKKMVYVPGKLLNVVI